MFEAPCIPWPRPCGYRSSEWRGGYSHAPGAVPQDEETRLTPVAHGCLIESPWLGMLLHAACRLMTTFSQVPAGD